MEKHRVVYFVGTSQDLHAAANLVWHRCEIARLASEILNISVAGQAQASACSIRGERMLRAALEDVGAVWVETDKSLEFGPIGRAFMPPRDFYEK